MAIPSPTEGSNVVRILSEIDINVGKTGKAGVKAKALAHCTRFEKFFLDTLGLGKKVTYDNKIYIVGRKSWNNFKERNQYLIEDQSQNAKLQGKTLRTVATDNAKLAKFSTELQAKRKKRMNTLMDEANIPANIVKVSISELDFILKELHAIDSKEKIFKSINKHGKFNKNEQSYSITLYQLAVAIKKHLPQLNSLSTEVRPFAQVIIELADKGRVSEKTSEFMIGGTASTAITNNISSIENKKTGDTETSTSSPPVTEIAKIKTELPIEIQDKSLQKESQKNSPEFQEYLDKLKYDSGHEIKDFMVSTWIENPAASEMRSSLQACRQDHLNTAFAFIISNYGNPTTLAQRIECGRLLLVLSAIEPKQYSFALDMLRQLEKNSWHPTSLIPECLEIITQIITKNDQPVIEQALSVACIEFNLELDIRARLQLLEKVLAYPETLKNQYVETIKWLAAICDEPNGSLTDFIENVDPIVEIMTTLPKEEQTKIKEIIQNLLSACSGAKQRPEYKSIRELVAILAKIKNTNERDGVIDILIKEITGINYMPDLSIIVSTLASIPSNLVKDAIQDTKQLFNKAKIKSIVVFAKEIAAIPTNHRKQSLEVISEIEKLNIPHSWIHMIIQDEVISKNFTSKEDLKHRCMQYIQQFEDKKKKLEEYEATTYVDPRDYTHLHIGFFPDKDGKVSLKRINDFFRNILKNEDET